jgi:hypothetical protein
MEKYKVNVDVFTEARISSDSLANIIAGEKAKLLGGSSRYIHNGVIYEEDYRFNGEEVIREATEEEIEVYGALRTVERHFRSK